MRRKNLFLTEKHKNVGNREPMDPQNKYYKEISPAEWMQLEQFRASHPIKFLDFHNQPIEYYSSGNGLTTLLLLPGGAGIAEINYKRILQVEKRFKVLAPSFMYTKTINEYLEFTNLLLSAENVNQLILLGGSGGGFLAQALFHRMYNRVAGMILSNTYPPIPEWVKSYKKMNDLFKILPHQWIKSLMIKKMGGLFKIEKTEELTPNQRDRVQMLYAHFTELMETKYVVKTILLPQYNFITEWNNDIYKPEFYLNWHGKILVMIDDQDKGYPYHSRLMAQFPNTTERIFHGTGHLTSLLAEEEYQKEIEKFLDEFV
jgi:pimeloyl-ACP methyl ester carboxylesterase